MRDADDVARIESPSRVMWAVISGGKVDHAGGRLLTNGD